MSLLEELFRSTKSKIDNLNKSIKETDERTIVSSFTYSFVPSTLAEAQAFSTTKVEYRHITDARKSGEGVGMGTGLPAFYDEATSQWVDMLGTPIST